MKAQVGARQTGLVYELSTRHTRSVMKKPCSLERIRIWFSSPGKAVLHHPARRVGERKRLLGLTSGPEAWRFWSPSRLVFGDACLATEFKRLLTIGRQLGDAIPGLVL